MEKKKSFSSAVSSEGPTPPQPPPHTQTFGYSGTHVVASGGRGWRPEPSGGRHDSPLFGRHRKRLYSIEHNESEATTASKDPQEPSSPVAPACQSGTNSVAVQPPRTPQGKATYTTLDGDRGLSAAQRVRIELTAHSDSRAGSGSRANSSEDVFAANAPTYDKKNGPRSCPSTFDDVERMKTKLSPGRNRHGRSGELIVSKLLPTRKSVNSLLTYLHELQISEASLRKQLLTTKKHTEEELYESLSKLNELQRTMQVVERDRRIAEQRLEEKEQRIRELAAKLEQAEARTSPIKDTTPEKQTTKQLRLDEKSKVSNLLLDETPDLKIEALTQPSQSTESRLRPTRLQSIQDEATNSSILSPRSPNRPLWDPWASGGTTPMKNLPPVFTIGPTGLNSMESEFPGSVEQITTIKLEDYELKSVLMSPRSVQGQVEALEKSDANELHTSPAPHIEQQKTDLQHPTPSLQIMVRGYKM
ncbi:hypothetical protein PHMEG_00033831, partial [Phytophthora megakarya]